MAGEFTTLVPAERAMHYDMLSGLPTRSQEVELERGHSTPSDDSNLSLAALMAENAAMRAQLSSLRLERTKLAETQQRIMDLLRVQSPDRLVHDVRNVLNELALLKALVDMPNDENAS